MDNKEWAVAWSCFDSFERKSIRARSLASLDKSAQSFVGDIHLAMVAQNPLNPLLKP